MEDRPKSRMTLRQALSGQWQIPLFAFSLVAFVIVIVHLRPEKVEPTFEELFEELGELSERNRYEEFYAAAELLRQQAQEDSEVGRIHLLVARVRVKELKQRHQLGLEPKRRSSVTNYESIISDYGQSLHFGCPAADSSEMVGVYHDLGLAYWCLSKADKAIEALHKAIELSDEFNPDLHKSLIKMYLGSRPKEYLSKVQVHLGKLLSSSETSEEDKAWGFVRQAEVMIRQGNEKQALEMLNGAKQSIKESRYGEELEFLRGRALRHAGQADEADLILRALIKRMADRGDIYAQTALELGKINYQQYRDHEARKFYELVIKTQMGKDWYVGAKLGMAECAVLQQRYDKSLKLYQEAVDLLGQEPHNRAVSKRDIQESLAVMANNLGLLKRYDLALSFMEIEQQVASADDIYAAHRFARMHARQGRHLQQQLQERQRARGAAKATEEQNKWVEEQQQLITFHFERAAEQFLLVASLTLGDDDLYGETLEQGANCYDKAGNVAKSIETWRQIVTEREGQPSWPTALFNLAQTLQSAGLYDEAITYYKILRDKHPRSLASFGGMVPMAKCYLAKTPPEKEKAEEILQSVLNDRTLTPTAPYFREAMFELGELYYNNEKYDQAINILTQAVDRYPNDSHLGKMLFLVADSYRQSGLILDRRLSELAEDSTATVSRERTSAHRRRNLESARDYFHQAIDFYSRRDEGSMSPLDEMYLRHSWLYHADCFFDLGLYREASEQYEQAAQHYQLTTTALAAFVQIANCQLKLGNTTAAQSAYQRASWQLRKMSNEDLKTGPTYLTRQQWESLFDWTGNLGLW